jgi:hypothetical protein
MDGDRFQNRETNGARPRSSLVVAVLSFGRQDAAERRLKAHRDIPFARDPSLHASFDWGDPYWKMASAVSGGCLAANPFDCALALARLVKEARGKAWVYEFGVPGVLTHAVCVVEAAGKWWVEDPFFDTTFKSPLAKVLETLEASGQPDRTPEKTQRICLVRASDTATMEALAPLASHELPAIGEVRRYFAPLRRETYLSFLDDQDFLFEALEDRGLPPAFESLMLLPLRGLRDGEPLDLAAAPGEPGAWFAARLGDRRRARREAVAQERVLARLTQKSREERSALQAESARSAELQAQLRMAVEAAETRAQDLERRATAAEASQVQLGLENDANAAALQIALAEAAAARGEVKQLEQRLEQLRAAADDATREAAAAVELRQDLAEQADRTSRAEQQLEAKRAALAGTRARALAALRKAAGTVRELSDMSRVLEEGRRAADQSLDDLRRQQESERGEAAERLREAEGASEALRAELATLAAGYAEEAVRAQALGAALEASAVREADLAALTDSLRGQVLELETARRSLSLALKDAAGRELALEDARRSVTLALSEQAAREATLAEQADGLRGRVADLEASEEALDAALRKSRAQAEAACAADQLKARVLENIARRAAAIGDFGAEGLDPFDALDRLSCRLAEVGADREALAAKLAAAAASHNKKLSVRISRMLGLVRRKPEGLTI